MGDKISLVNHIYVIVMHSEKGCKALIFLGLINIFNMSAQIPNYVSLTVFYIKKGQNEMDFINSNP